MGYRRISRRNHRKSIGIDHRPLSALSRNDILHNTEMVIKMVEKLTKKNLEDLLIEMDALPSIFEPICSRFDLNRARIILTLNEKHAPKPDIIIDNMGVFLMRRSHGREYNVFRLDGDRYASIVFDRNRRPYWQSPAAVSIEDAIKFARRTCEILAKGQCIAFGFTIDEGKAIREKEELAQKQAAMVRRGGKKS